MNIELLWMERLRSGTAKLEPINTWDYKAVQGDEFYVILNFMSPSWAYELNMLPDEEAEAQVIDRFINRLRQLGS